MKSKPYIEEFIKTCSQTPIEETREKFIGWEYLITILVYEGIKLLLPEIREWLKLGASAVALKRLEIKKRLIEYAKAKELEFPQAEKAAEAVADNLNEETLKRIAKELE